MREKFTDRLHTGTIKISMDEHKGVWVADKEKIVNSIVEIAEEYD